MGATVSNFETLDFAANAKVSMTAGTWDQFVATTGNATGGHAVTGAAGVEEVTLTSTTASSTAFTDLANAGAGRVDNYILTNAGADTFRVNEQNAGQHTLVNLVGGGTDTLTLNDVNAVLPGADISASVFNFTSGGGGNFDVLSVLHNGTSISNLNYQSFGGSLFGTNVTAGVNVINLNPTSGGIFALGDIASVWTQAVARTYIDAAVANVAVGDYTVVAYNGADADIMAMHIVTANNVATAQIDLVGVLHGVGSNSMLSSNFA